MKPKTPRTKRAGGNSRRLDQAVLKKRQREVEATANAYLREAKLRAAAMSPIANAFASRFPWLAKAAKQGHDNAIRLLKSQPAIVGTPSHLPPSGGSGVYLPYCRAVPYDDAAQTSFKEKAVTADPSHGLLAWKGEATGTAVYEPENALGTPGVAIKYDVQAPGLLHADVIARVTAQVARLSCIFFGLGAGVQLRLDATLEDMSISAHIPGAGRLWGGKTEIITWPYGQDDGTTPYWGYDSRTITSQLCQVSFQYKMTYAAPVKLWAEMYAYVVAGGFAAATIDCHMTIERICLRME
jgi:hypothetical protein